MAPTFAKKFNLFEFLAKPVDSGKQYKGTDIFGSHKTWRGAILGIFAGFLAVLLQTQLYQKTFFREISVVNYSQINIFLFSFLLSGGAVFGDLFFAFVKRRLRLQPGAKFIPFDQTNYVIGAYLFLNPFFKISFSFWISLLVLTFFLHIIFNRLGYLLGLHKAKW
jgi:CDP-2,3-bis-(O-geranylgeranyl)-sn-glycerol synthase